MERGGPSRTGDIPAPCALPPAPVRMRRMRNGEVSIVDWPNRAALDFFHIAAGENPISSQGRQALNWIERHGPSRTGTIVAPRPAGVINSHRLVDFDLAGHGFGRRERDFAEGHTDVGIKRARDVNLA